MPLRTPRGVGPHPPDPSLQPQVPGHRLRLPRTLPAMPSRHGGGRKRPAEHYGEDAFAEIPVEQEERVEEADDDWQSPPRSSMPPLKRKRTSPPRRPRMPMVPNPGRGLPCVRITGVPAEYTYEMLMELHESFCLDVSAVDDIEFEPSHNKGRDGPVVRGVMVRYSNEETALGAAQTLEGQPVANRSGETLFLTAKLIRRGGGGVGGYRGGGYGGGGNCYVDQRTQGRGGWQGGPGRGPPHRWGSPRRGWKGEGKDGGRRSKGPEVIYPSAYISDVPVEYKETTMVKLHEACSLDPSKIMGMKFLPPQDSAAETCCCIVRYLDQDSADKAVEAIRGRPVQLRSGICKFFGAKIAKPARWMIEMGVAPDGSKLGDGDSKKEQSKEFDWCAQGPNCIGKVGMQVIEDLSTGMPFCEACWDLIELEDAENSAAAATAAENAGAWGGGTGR